MKVNLKRIIGPWAVGWALDKHMLRSTYVGDDANGRPKFDSLRSEAGEAIFLLKYRSDWSQASRLADAIATNICANLDHVGFIVPMPASTPRPRQPVAEIARALSKVINRPVFENLLLKAPTNQRLKDLHGKQEKVAALGNSFSIHDEIRAQGAWNVLLVDDLYDSGASMEAAATALSTYPKVRNVYVTACTWK